MEHSDTTKRNETRSDDSDDTDDEIIVKTPQPMRQPIQTTTPVEQRQLIDLDSKCQENEFQNSSDNTGHTAVMKDDLADERDSRQNRNLQVNGDCRGNFDTEDDVINKAPRQRMTFQRRPESNSTPTKSCLNGHARTSAEHPMQHENKESAANYQDSSPSEDNKAKTPQSTSGTSKQKSFCLLN